MTEQEAIKELQENIDLAFGSSVSNEASEMAIKALDKQIAKKPIRKNGECYSYAKDGTKLYEIITECPTCHSIALKYSYPCRCGQILDWE